MMTNYLGDQCVSDLLGSAIPRTNSGLRLPADLDNRNVLLPPSAEQMWNLGDAWGGVTELSELHNDLVHVRAGEYVSNEKYGLFRRRLRRNEDGGGKLVEGGGGPVYGEIERDVVLTVPRG